MFLRFTRKAFDEIDLDKTGRADYKEARFYSCRTRIWSHFHSQPTAASAIMLLCVSIHVYDFTTGVHWYTQDL